MFERDGKVATVGLGYADSFLTAISNKGYFVIDGQYKVRVAGRISMDLITLDVTDVPDDLLIPGKFVEVLGTNRKIFDMSREAGIVSYEVLTRLSTRHTRHYIGDTA